MVAAHHDVHAQQGKQRETKHLAAAQHASVGRVVASINQRHKHRQRSKTLKPMTHWVRDDHAAKRHDGLPVQCIARIDDGQRSQGQQSGNVGRRAFNALHTQVGDGDHTRHHQQENFRVGSNPAKCVDHV